MKFLELKKNLQDQLLFTSGDAKKIDDDFDYRRLSEWQKKGYIKKITKGNYIFTDKDLTEEDLFSIANKIYYPSYISLQSALRYYNLIPEGVFSITSVSTKKTNRFETSVGSFDYRKIKPSLFFDYKIMGKGSSKLKIATPEKAIVDYFYLNTNYNSKKEISELRISKSTFSEKVNITKIENLLDKINSDSLNKRVAFLINYLKND